MIFDMRAPGYLPTTSELEDQYEVFATCFESILRRSGRYGEPFEVLSV